MAGSNPYRILGLQPGASERELKQAYRKLALQFHPDLNPDPRAEAMFREIQEAYDQISEGRVVQDAEPDYSWDEVMEEIRRDRERRVKQAKARQAKKKKEEDFFNKEEWHDLLLLIKYLLHGLALLIGLASIIFPFVIAVIAGPASFVGTVYFLLIGAFILYYIYSRRKTWFRLGRFRLKMKDIKDFFRMPEPRASKDSCLYSAGTPADGKAVRIELISIQDILVRSFGAMNHQANYKSKVKHIVLPRSSRAQYWHRMSTVIKLLSLLLALIFLPFSSIIWRILAGLFVGMALSTLVLKMAGVREKSSYLLTPELLVKMVLWLGAMAAVSVFGPGFEVRTTSAVYIVVAGMLFLLDMLFDLLVGLFPFYKKMFIPMFRQGEIMSGLYREGYQNYLEIPFYSILYPLFRWLF